MPAIPSSIRVALLAAPLMLAAGCAANLPRDVNGSPPTARLAPDSGSRAPAAPLSPEERKRLDALNKQVLREQEAAIARDQQAQAWARASAYAYPAYPLSSWSLYYGGWGRGRWGGGVSIGSPGYWGWGGYPYWWW
ncbi:hypothetical protein K6V71_23440 [Cupriavidus gilardii]|uniref:hypothetical protein n=1 Tax=Cupriavidus gilardii TaxID=82541 RepID=UPI0021B312EC|nr:hypothetical protein [Cupriavidus gilardii]UXC34963.1 hypothetical protein N4G38_11095 [Cupriavidus gilardii]